MINRQKAPLRLTPKGRRRGRSYTRPHRLPLGVPARPLRPPVPVAPSPPVPHEWSDEAQPNDYAPRNRKHSQKLAMNGLMPEAPLRLTPKGRRRGRSYTRPHRLPLGVPARPLRPPVPRGARPTLAPSVALPSFRGRLTPTAPRSKRARWGF